MTDIHDFADQAADQLPDPPPPARFEDIDEADAFGVMIRELRAALGRIDEDDPYALAVELDRNVRGTRLAWLRAISYVAGPARTTESAALALEARFIDAFGDAEPSALHVTARTALASALSYMTLGARERNAGDVNSEG